MIELTTGNILQADAEALVNTVNCVGIMGRGIALQFKNQFPENFEAYAAACAREAVRPGKMFVFETRSLTNPKYIINFPTKRHWKGKSRMEDIESGLQALVAEIRERGIRSIAIPPLGSGLGGLAWLDVKPRIVDALRGINDVRVIIFEPTQAPVATKSRDVPSMTAGRAALVVLVHRYLGGLLDPFVTLIELQKLMYFMQEAGQPLRLNYIKHHYGPYADNLRHVLTKVEGHMLSGYHDGGDAPDKLLELVPGAVKDAEAFLASDDGTRTRFDRVGKLVEGFETPFGLELLATVHWVATREGAATPDEVRAKVYAWNDRKRQFTPRQIEIALSALQAKGWIAGSSASLAGQAH
ncbi:type II toxin-antitoxin system antitoxin DNA ADP-ribosyl glycohydrolase DarG [Phenylobacterium sp.]|jgi:O-acetyl-ADP-ribose deacetylase (regulator of RNase III)|uniref:type II toxin-antitoxin system antitoxin DNA ADP-ribosyl glycohydrolase DarG n=1 Tax=Phenylobacterium sp. TaxID=1871053 RepID=UPI002E335E5D|nr:macro domain-containing protein [Phenylobacterium sp.]HEX3364377.1 macro domain-containing protein [Phenylobacterium sp.]